MISRFARRFTPAWGSKAEYFAGAREKAQFVREFRILRQWEDGNDVATFYELDIVTPAGAATLAMAEWHALLNDRRLASTFMVFDSNARATLLLRDALVRLHP